ncbi:MAG: 3'-5' exonuclease [Campylobacterales bacterium]|nr:3'-5' exonuclease [Campylobacterales bacterium]
MLVFLDIKTTGFEADDTICAVSLLQDGELIGELVNENKKISPEASAAHHISNKMIQNASEFKETRSAKVLQTLSDEDTLVLHDYEFMFMLLNQQDINIHAEVIDTKRVTKHTISDLARFDLQYLRYELQLFEEKELVYKPLEDVLVIRSLFDYHIQSLSKEEMCRLSFEHVLLEKLSFGKYSGRYIEDIVQKDPHYLRWMLSLENLDADLRYTIEYYLQG